MNNGSGYFELHALEMRFLLSTAGTLDPTFGAGGETFIQQPATFSMNSNRFRIS